MSDNIRTGKGSFLRGRGAMLVTGQLVVVLALLLSNVGAVQAQIPFDDPIGTTTPSDGAPAADATATATEPPPTEPSPVDTSAAATPTPEMLGVAIASAHSFNKISPPNLALVVETDQFQLKWSDAGIDVETPGGDSYFYCIDEVNDDICNNSWVQKRNLQTAAGDVVVVVGHTYFWQVRTDFDGVYADCEGCWWSFTVVPNPNKTISGVTGLPGTHVNYVGTTSGSVTAGAGGAYTLTVPNHWSGTVTPTLSGYSFSPVSRIYLDVTTNQVNQDYTPGLPVVYTISGDADLAGVTLKYAGTSATGSATSLLGGGYSFAVPSGWTGTVTPFLPHFTFTPTSRSYVGLAANTPAQDYSARPDVILYRSGAWLPFDFATGAFVAADSRWTGNPGGACIPAQMDYDGDGVQEMTQLCDGNWNIYNDDGSLNKTIVVGNVAGQRPVPADYNNDGMDDFMLFRDGAWLYYDFATALNVPAKNVWTGDPGGNGIPAPMDYNGDGSADRTILADGAWHFYNANGSYNKGIWVGNVAGQLPVPADYDGNGTDDVMVFRSGAWLSFNFATGAYQPGSSAWTGNPPPPAGGGATKPAPLDYDGDGTVDFTMFAGGPWHFYNDNGSYNKGIWVGKNTADLAISRRLLP